VSLQTGLPVRKQHAKRRTEIAEVKPHELFNILINFTPRPLYSQYPMDKRLGGSHSLSGHSGGEQKSPLPVPVRDQTPAIHPVNSHFKQDGLSCVTLFLPIVLFVPPIHSPLLKALRCVTQFSVYSSVSLNLTSLHNFAFK
jgi:hypothetical protein